TTRANENVEAIACAVADVDHLQPAELAALEARLATLGLAYVCYSTYSSQPEAPCARFVVPFTRPVAPVEWPALWPRINAYVFAGRNDAQTKDPSRFFYRPACPPGAAPFARHHEGGALNPDALPPAPAAASNGHAPAAVLGARIPTGERNGTLTSLA